MTTARATRILAVGLTGAALLFAGCGDDSSSDSTAASTSAATSAATTPAEPAARVIRNPYRRPVHRPHPGARVDQLIIRDVRVGDGETLEAGDTAIADYHGTIYQSGRFFDGSWEREAAEFRIDSGVVVDGWWQGLPGMRVGGRRTLVIPPALAYRDQATPTIPANSTLYFTVDLLGVRKATAAGAVDPATGQPTG